MDVSDLHRQAERINADPAATPEQKVLMWKRFAEFADANDPRRTQAVQQYMYWCGVCGKNPEPLGGTNLSLPSSSGSSTGKEENPPSIESSSGIHRFFYSYASSLFWTLSTFAPITGLLVIAEVLGLAEVGLGVANTPNAGLISVFAIVGAFIILIASGYGISWSRTKLKASPPAYNHGLPTQIVALIGLFLVPISFLGLVPVLVIFSEEFVGVTIGWVSFVLLLPLFLVLFIWCITRLNRGKETALSKPIVPPGFERSQGGERAFLIFGSLTFVVLGIFMLNAEDGLFGNESLNQLIAMLVIGFFSLTFLFGLLGIKAGGAQPLGVLKEAATLGRHKTTDRKSMNAFWWVIILATPFTIWMGIREANSPAYKSNTNSQTNTRLDRIRKKPDLARSTEGQQEADRLARDIVQGMADNVYHSYLRNYQLPVKRLQITSMQASGISGGDWEGTMDIRFSWRMPLTNGDKQLLATSRNMGLRNKAAIDEVLAMSNGTSHQVRVHFRQDGFGDFTYETELLY